MRLKKGQKVRIKVALASGLLECAATIVRYEPPPPGPSYEGCKPIIWVQPEGKRPVMSVTMGDLVPEDVT